jgi:hypothetical protein
MEGQQRILSYIGHDYITGNLPFKEDTTVETKRKILSALPRKGRRRRVRLLSDELVFEIVPHLPATIIVVFEHYSQIGLQRTLVARVFVVCRALKAQLGDLTHDTFQLGFGIASKFNSAGSPREWYVFTELVGKVRNNVEGFLLPLKVVSRTALHRHECGSEGREHETQNEDEAKFHDPLPVMFFDAER